MIKYGINTFIWASPFQTKDLHLLEHARALGFDEVGSLEAGQAADFIVLDAGHIIPAGAPTAESTEDLLSRILHRAGRSAVRRTYVGGVLRHGQDA